jgi:hypothetical protein
MNHVVSVNASPTWSIVASKVSGWGTRRTGPDTATGDTMAGFGALRRIKLQVALIVGNASGWGRAA